MSLNFTSRALAYAALSAGVVLAFFVLREHWAHALGLAPYLLLLACPLMHFFHHGHGNHGHRRAGLAEAPPTSRPSTQVDQPSKTDPSR